MSNKTSKFSAIIVYSVFALCALSLLFINKYKERESIKIVRNGKVVVTEKNSKDSNQVGLK